MCLVHESYRRVRIPRRRAKIGYKICRVRPPMWEQHYALLPQFMDSPRFVQGFRSLRRVKADTKAVHYANLPTPMNSYGYHAYSTLAEAKRRLTSDCDDDHRECIYRVRLWGVVIVAENGYRASLMRFMDAKPIRWGKPAPSPH